VSVVRIKLDSLQGNKGSFVYTYQTGELELGDDRVRLTGPVEISGRVKREGHQVTIFGVLTTSAEVDCDRCLKSIGAPVNADFHLRYVTVQDYESMPATELEEADMTVSVFDGEAIDVDELAREQILLGVPAHTVCAEDCKGLCPFCGANRNLKDCGCQEVVVDPRWAALKELVNGK
jgi:uncharacterized protein